MSLGDGVRIASMMATELPDGVSLSAVVSDSAVEFHAWMWKDDYGPTADERMQVLDAVVKAGDSAFGAEGWQDVTTSDPMFEESIFERSKVVDGMKIVVWAGIPVAHTYTSMGERK